MEMNNFFNLIKNKRQTILSVLIVFFVFSLVFTALQPFKYSSKVRLLIVQDAKSANLDAYALSRANEYLSNILAKVVHSGSFYIRVMNSGLNIDQNYFGLTKNKQFKKWNKTVFAKAMNDSGIISLVVYHSDQQQAEQIVRGVAYVLMTQNNNYHGFQGVSVKLLDEPITSQYPVKPNIVLNLILALVLGIIFSLSYIYLFPEEKYSLRLFNKKQQEKIIEDWLLEEDNYKEVEGRTDLEKMFIQEQEKINTNKEEDGDRKDFLENDKQEELEVDVDYPEVDFSEQENRVVEPESDLIEDLFGYQTDDIPNEELFK